MSTVLKHQIVIIGGGAAGITVAAQLLKKAPSLDLAIIEPSTEHCYQPAWTLVGGGAYKLEDTIKPEGNYIPTGAKWIVDAVKEVNPDTEQILTQNGTAINYDYLVVCPGIQLDWGLIPGLATALGKEGVTSNYSRQHVNYTWEAIRQFQGGNAIFTFPATPIKCAGAPQKIMYLADEVWRRQGVRDKSRIIFCTATPKLFGVPEYCKALEAVVARKGIEVLYLHNLKEIKPATKEAVFEVTKETGKEIITLNYDFIHVAPPMSAPDFLKNSPLAIPDNPLGWVDVDKYTLQHRRYSNVFSLGDASSLPTSKTAAAIRKQTPVLVANLLGVIKNQKTLSQYQGYTCCPLVTSYTTTIMAEFDYDQKLTPSFPLDPTQERWSMWLVKRYVLPWLYWNRMLKGEPFEADLLKAIFS